MTTREPTHISLFMPSLAGGGAERMMLNLAREFCGTGARVTLVLATSTGEYAHLVPPSVEVVDLNRPGVVTAIPRLAQYLRRTKPDSMLVTLDHAAVAAIFANGIARAGTKVFVRQACGVSSQERPTLKERLLPWVQKVAYPFAEKVLAVSRGVADDIHITLGVPRERIEVLANPVLTDDLHELALKPAGHPWVDEPSGPIILAAGRLHRQKGFDTLIDAFAMVPRSIGARLIILGEGTLRATLTEHAARLGVRELVSMPGFAKNPFAFMRRASVFVLSSRWEGMPGVLLQAMACGCPVVSTNCPSGPDEILNDGQLGPLVRVDDAAGMAEAIQSVLKKPTPADALRAAVSPYSAGNSAKRYLAVLARTA
ncbi:MAG TPA: glycosyltransferase [Gemmatimonadaceae bacterium]|nr:glycosyltransferase [Gemmatimonadaceae bacterium]